MIEEKGAKTKKVTGTKKPVSKKILGVFALAMINVAAVLSIRNFPSMAEFGWSSIGWYIIGTILFLIPISLAGAELATGWPEGGGVYAWVKQAFGEKGGFIAIFCDWSNNLVWFPTVLAFIASTLAFAITPTLADNPIYMLSVMMIVFWGTTAIAYFGPEVTAKFSNVGVILGSIVPISHHHLFWDLVGNYGGRNSASRFFSGCSNPENRPLHPVIFRYHYSHVCRDGDGRVPCA